jgi:hypothetical protein
LEQNENRNGREENYLDYREIIAHRASTTQINRGTRPFWPGINHSTGAPAAGPGHLIGEQFPFYKRIAKT